VRIDAKVINGSQAQGVQTEIDEQVMVLHAVWDLLEEFEK
jgi:hypothetical protein